MPFNLGTGEVLLILLVALLVLGPNKLPEAARSVGKGVAELRRMSSGFQAELRDAMQEPVASTPASATGSTSAKAQAELDRSDSDALDDDLDEDDLDDAIEADELDVVIDTEPPGTNGHRPA